MYSTRWYIGGGRGRVACSSLVWYVGKKESLVRVSGGVVCKKLAVVRVSCALCMCCL